jgi:hypothetical protein
MSGTMYKREDLAGMMDKMNDFMPGMMGGGEGGEEGEGGEGAIEGGEEEGGEAKEEL